jgi:hypothetical protein
MSARRALVFCFASALLTAYGCGGGGNDVATLPPSLACSDGGAVTPNTVALTCGAATDSETERVDVVLAGPASGTTTLRGLNFDVTYDPTKIVFVPDASFTSPLFSPNALVAVTLLDNQPGHLVVAIQEFGGLPDVAVGAGPHIVIALSFQRAAGATFGPTPLSFVNAEATSASPPITFVDGLLLSYS